MTEPPPWLSAMQQLDELQRAADVLALVRGAHRAGLLALLAEPVALPLLSEQLGAAPSRVDAALRLLAAHGITCQRNNGWALSESWAPMALGMSPVPFAGTLGWGSVRAAQFEGCLTGGADYWQLDDTDRLLVATGVSPDPASPATMMMARRDLETLPDVVAALERGGRALELGCGVGSRMCALLQAFPAATAVGLELATGLVEYGQRRAEALGVGDRVTYIAGDATAYQPAAEFDLVTWSQFFFPTRTRQAALSVARHALRPGGWITMPVLWDGVDPQPGTASQELAADRLQLEIGACHSCRRRRSQPS